MTAFHMLVSFSVLPGVATVAWKNDGVFPKIYNPSLALLSSTFTRFFSLTKPTYPCDKGGDKLEHAGLFILRSYSTSIYYYTG